MKFVENKYGNKFTNTEGGEGEFVHDKNKIEVDVMLTLITAKNGIKRHIKMLISSM